MAKSGNPRDNRNKKGRSIPDHNNPDVLLKRQGIGIAAYGTAEEYKDVSRSPKSGVSRRKKSAILPSYAEIAAGYEGYTNPLFDGVGGLEPEDIAERPLEDYEESADFGPGWEDIEAPTTTPEYPRALAAAYHRRAELLVILFRAPGHYDRKAGIFTPTGTAPYIMYEDVSLDMWNDLKNTSSTGSWLRSSGVESHTYYKTSITGAIARANSL